MVCSLPGRSCNSQVCRKSRDLVLNYPVLFRVPIVKVICFLRIPANIVSFKISCRNYCLCSGVKKLILYPNINILAECIIAPWMTMRVALPLMIKPLLYVAARVCCKRPYMHYSALWRVIRPIRTRHNSANDRVHFLFPFEARENEAVIAEVSRHGEVAKSSLVRYIPWNARNICIRILNLNFVQACIWMKRLEKRINCKKYDLFLLNWDLWERTVRSLF